jgi:DNA-binding response OmpR family regulator
LSANLTDTEVTLLTYLLNNPYRVISKERLGNAIASEGLWGKKTGNAISQYVFRLRRKLKELKIDSVCIKTIYGKGYKLTTPTTPVNHPSDFQP